MRHPRGRELVMVPKSRPRIGRSMAAYACLGIITRRRPGGSGSASSGAMGRRRARSSASLGAEPVGELGAGAELGGGAVSSARRSPLKKVTFKTMTCGPLFTVANTVLIYPSIVCYGKQTQNLSVLQRLNFLVS